MGALDLSALLPFVATLVIASLAAGFLAGLFGVGGGGITVPVLYSAYNAVGIDPAITMHLAVGTSLVMIIPMSILSFRSHLKRGAVDRELIRQWLIIMPLGAIAGGLVAASMSSASLRAAFAMIAFTMGLRMVVGKLPFSFGSDLPGRTGRGIAGFVIGALSSIMGIGGGAFNNTFMTLHGRSMHQAVATSSGVGVLIAIPGAVPYIALGWSDPALPPFSVGYVSIVTLAFLVPLSMLVVPAGAALAHRLSKRHLEIAFGLFLMTVATRFVVSLL